MRDWVLKYLREAYEICKKLGGTLSVNTDSVVCFNMQKPKMLRRLEYNFVLGDYSLGFEVPWEYWSEREAWMKIGGIHWDDLKITHLPESTFEKLKKEGWDCKKLGEEWVCRKGSELVYSVKPIELWDDIDRLEHVILFTGRYIAKLPFEEMLELRNEIRKFREESAKPVYF